MNSWFCNTCDKTINFKSKSKHIISNSHKLNEKNNILVRVYEFDNPDIIEIFPIIDNCARDCFIK